MFFVSRRFKRPVRFAHYHNLFSRRYATATPKVVLLRTFFDQRFPDRVHTSGQCLGSLDSSMFQAPATESFWSQTLASWRLLFLSRLFPIHNVLMGNDKWEGNKQQRAHLGLLRQKRLRESSYYHMISCQLAPMLEKAKEKVLKAQSDKEKAAGKNIDKGCEAVEHNKTVVTRRKED